MKSRLIVLGSFLSALMVASTAHAWFFFMIPTGAIQKAMEVDPESVQVSSSDRVLGQCAGFHLNQAQKGMSTTYPDDRYPGAAAATAPSQTPQSKFHSDMADLALQRSGDKDQVKKLAEAYSIRWGRVGSADVQTGRQYSANLIRACGSQDIPLQYSEYSGWQSRQEEKQRRADDERRRIAAEQEQKRAQEAVEQQRLRAEAQMKLQQNAGELASREGVGAGQVNFVAEARKSALILGCPTADVSVTGAESSHVLMAANCGKGQLLLLKCDPTGICLKR